jgi:3-oxoacyl-[acyl-carrier protein] reductase
MDLGIKGRVAVVAASSRGLGRAVAEALAAEGAKLALCARDENALAEAAAAIKDRWRGEVFHQALDVTSETDVKTFIAETRRRLGDVSICVTNAGGPPPGNFAAFSTQDWRSAFELNFMSTLFFIAEVLGGMRAQKWGRVVTITSTAVKQPMDGLILSNGIRAGVVGLMKSLANEYGPENVLFNNVCPGRFDTARMRNNAAKQAAAEGVTVEEIVQRAARRIPLRRVGDPAEFAAVVAFLCSEKASYVTGANILVDGGIVSGV